MFPHDPQGVAERSWGMFEGSDYKVQTKGRDFELF
jgi:hypothetical protein